MKALKLQKPQSNESNLLLCANWWPAAEEMTLKVSPVLPQGLDQVEVCEFVKFHKGVEDLDVEIIPARDETRVFWGGL